jgi:AcrR family transcriptional regulator
VFRETWGDLLQAVHEVEESGEDAREQLRRVAAIFLRAWRRTPDLVRVLVREVARSPQMQERVDEIGHAFHAIERIVARGQVTGTLRAGIEPRLASWIFYGAIEEILTGWVMGQLPDGEEEVAVAERTVVDVLCEGLAVDRAIVPV